MRTLSFLLIAGATVHAQAIVPKLVGSIEQRSPPPTLFKRQQFQEPCEEVAASWVAQKANATSDQIYVPAQVAYDCLQSVPVDKDGDVKQIEELKQFLQFQSTLSYLKDRPENQTKPVDIIGELDAISSRVQQGAYTSDYEVQLAIKVLLDSAVDFHLRWSSDILEPFVFQRYGVLLTSLSQDGLSPPSIYLATDLAAMESFNFTPSPIKSINGKNATEYLYNISMQANYHDADARYNRLFLNKPRVSSGSVEPGPFAQGGLFDGPTTSFVFANGTNKTVENLAFVGPNFDFTNVTDGESFFSTFCQGGPPDDTEEATPTPTPTSRNQTSSTATPTPEATPTGYPTPIFFQSSLAVQGYYLNDTGYDDTAVLAIPNFGPKTKATNETGAMETQRLLRAFFADCIKQKKTKLIIDLRGNGGGTIDVGFEVFKQLFPTVQPYGASRYRAHDAFHIFSAAIADFASNTTVEGIDPDAYAYGSENNFYFGNIMNVDGQPFKSFQDYYGPYTFHNDTFISPRRYNFSNHAGGYTSSASFNLTGYAPEPTPPQPFDASNMLIIQDGLCGSTCAIFSELMREQAHVPTIFVGGRPMNSPAQGVGGSKGAQVLPIDALVENAELVAQYTLAVDGAAMSKLLNESAFGVLANPEQLKKRSAHYTAETIAGAMNALDNLKQNDSTQTPLEFIYEAADCRLFDTFESFFSPVPLWKRAVDARWGSGKCVEGSMGHSTAISVMKGEGFNKQQVNATEPFTGAAEGLRMSGLMAGGVAVVVAALML